MSWRPFSTTANMATDHNQLTMEMMKKVAERHGLVCLLHEKPFDGVNGSGKHNNWSLSTDTGVTCWIPATPPWITLQFLTLPHRHHQGCGRLSGSAPRHPLPRAGNDHRLGANEAPPAIISIFVGDELGAILDSIANDSPYEAKGKAKIDLGVDVLPVFPKDNTDRNRTSPFAFTGNKFEFRMPGSAMNLSDANTVLNTAVAKVLKDFAAEMEGAEDFTAAAAAWIKKTIKAHERILFNGNGYSAEWEAEAEKRGLLNMKTTVDALPCMLADKNIQLMNEMNVLSPVEMQSRYEVELEHYSKVINIESLTTLGMARRQLIPAALEFLSSVAETAAAKKAVSEGTLHQNRGADSHLRHQGCGRHERCRRQAGCSDEQGGFHHRYL